MDRIEWISAWNALSLLYKFNPHSRWREIITERLSAGLIRSRAARIITEDFVKDDQLLDETVWGKDSRIVNDYWESGDFEFRVRYGFVAKAFGVLFAKSDIEKMVEGATPVFQPRAVLPTVPTVDAKPKQSGGRPLEFAHSEAAAAVTARLLMVPDWKERPITQAAVQAELTQAYERLNGRTPKEDTLERAAQGIWRVLNDARAKNDN